MAWYFLKVLYEFYIVINIIMLQLRHYFKILINNPREFYSKGRWEITWFFLKFIKFRNWRKWVLWYLSSIYGWYLESLPLYKDNSERENVVWWCRFQGLKNAPKLNKVCLKSVKKYVKDRKIIVLNYKNIDQYVEFPKYIIEKYRKGYIPIQHFSDLLRLELLIKYGWTRIDSTVLLTWYENILFNSDFFVFSWNNYDNTILSSRFITANKGNPILLTTRDLLYRRWEKENYLIDYFLFHIFFTISAGKYPEIWNKIPKYSNKNPHIMQSNLFNNYDKEKFKEFCKKSSVHKLNFKIDLRKISNNSLFRYIENM